MKKHENGSVTFSKTEYRELCRAYLNMRTILSSQPTYLGDYFRDQHPGRKRVHFMHIEKWHALLEGRSFTSADRKELLE